MFYKADRILIADDVPSADLLPSLQMERLGGVCPQPTVINIRIWCDSSKEMTPPYLAI